MSIYFFDSSALVKRYMLEAGSSWIQALLAKAAQHEFIIAQITPIEIMSAMARQYHDQQITFATLQNFRRLLLRHTQTQYQILGFSTMIAARALSLHEEYRLRAYDAVQLASALVLQQQLLPHALSFTFLSADVRLLEAASAAGLTTDNPRNHE